ncbi:MAG: Cytochrome b561 [Candidatus Celerinatantimonas neptuna]|nr:MAG: Cytochrome b561 [Candidatus Celerinatantimonas neptuna]
MGYSRLRINLHWLTVLLVFGAYLAINLESVFDSYRVDEWLMTIHYNLGLTIWCVMMIRWIIFLLDRKTPSIEPEPPRWQQRIAKLLHWILYGCFLCLPVLGVLTVALRGESWEFWGVTISALPFNYHLSHIIKEIHEWVATVGYYLIGIHAFAALYHHFHLKDNTLVRMLRP